MWNFENIQDAQLNYLTYNDAASLAGDDAVVVGAKYYITDRDIMLTGEAPNLFSTEGQRIMRILKEDVYNGDIFNTVVGAISDVVVDK